MNEPGGAARPSVGPPAILEHAGAATVQQFLNLYGDTKLLLVRLMPDAPELEDVLAAQEAKHSVPVQPSVQRMGFHTEVYAEPRQSPPSERTRPAGQSASAEAVADLLRRGRHFVVPLRKRASADTSYANRISIGRAHNKDIVLRHTSVSKFHGWFELGEDDKQFHYADAGSRNGTRINGEPCPSRQLVRVAHGDEIVFGVVSARLCRPEVFFEALRQR